MASNKQFWFNGIGWRTTKEGVDQILKGDFRGHHAEVHYAELEDSRFWKNDCKQIVIAFDRSFLQLLKNRDQVRKIATKLVRK